MHLSREYVGYLAREVTHRVSQRHLVAAPDPAALAGWVLAAMNEELGVEDRINEEARAILAQHEAEMQRLGASYSEAFKKIKAELVRKHKVVL
ncbi:MAG: DUF507 family protein [Terriglobales bacterium]